MSIPTPADSLRALLRQPGIIAMPCCFDALSAKLIEQAGDKQAVQRIKAAADCRAEHDPQRAAQ